MFERFTEAAREVVVTAQSEAALLSHNYVGTEHLLLGLLDVGGPGGEVLRDLGVTREAVRREVVHVVEGGTSGPFTPSDASALEAIGIDLQAVRLRAEEAFGPGALDRPRPGRRRRRRRCGRSAELGSPLTPRAKKVLELSLREALNLRHHHVGTEHVLMGLLAEGEGLAVQLLIRLRADPQLVRARVLDRIGRVA